ncbi:MAG: flavodoxin family protein [Clostridiales bacterium]|nr:flavodoxin family protein [Clostridiales bacterium]
MKVMLVNGSSREHGCTARALQEVAAALQAEGIETEILFIGNQPIADCTACGCCGTLGSCIFNDAAAEFGRRAAEFDGFVFGSPVYYAHPSGRLLSFMDRAFYASGANFRFKPAAAVLSARRAGNTASLDVITKHFTINCMPVVSSTYWNHVHGNTPEEVEQDLEGLQTMTNLGKNMAWMLKCIRLGQENGITPPKLDKVYTNFIR